MQFPQLQTGEDRAVSPVIGVILMVAITVILAAVIASFVLGLGDSQEVQPTATFDFNYDSSDNMVDVTHKSGDAIANSSLMIRGESMAATDNQRAWKTNLNGGNGTEGTTSGSLDGEDAIISGDSVTVGVGGDDYVVRLVWESSGGETTATLAEDSGPAA